MWAHTSNTSRDVLGLGVIGEAFRVPPEASHRGRQVRQVVQLPAPLARPRFWLRRSHGFLVRGGSNRRVEACSASNALRSASNALRSYTFVLQLSRNLGSFSARQGLWPTVRVQSLPEENNVWVAASARAPAHGALFTENNARLPMAPVALGCRASPVQLQLSYVI